MNSKRHSMAGGIRALRQAGGFKLPAGFTLIELLLVIFIMILLTLMTLPLFYQFVKNSRVQQTANIVATTISRARMEAMRTRRMTGIFFGDNPADCKTKPTPGIMPAKGRIEIWTVKDNSWNDVNDEEGINSAAPYNNQGNWYPYMYPDRCLTPEPITFPDGVRVLCGRFYHQGGPLYYFGWQAGDYVATGDGELKRHILALGRNGMMPGWYDGLNSWWDILVFDNQTGEHLVISAGDWMTSAKPRILPFQLNFIWSVAGGTNAIVKTTDVALYAK